MNRVPCTVSFEISWEALKNGTEEYRPDIWDVSDDLECMVTDLCLDLIACCTTGQRAEAGPSRDFTMLRDGANLILHQQNWFDPREQRWRSGDDSRHFSIDLSDFIREFFSAVFRFHADLKQAIGGAEDPRLASLKTFFEEQEKIARRALPNDVDFRGK